MPLFDAQLVCTMDRLVDILQENHKLSSDLGDKLTLDQFKHDMDKLCEEINQKASKYPVLNFEYPIT